MRLVLIVALGSLLGTGAGVSAEQRELPPPARTTDIVLTPTNHPRVSADLSQLWLAPVVRVPRTAAQSDFAEAVRLEVDANFAKALPILSQPALRQGPLGDYAAYYQALAQMRLGRTADAKTAFHEISARAPLGYLTEAAALREAEADEALGDQGAALQIYEQLANTKTTAPEDVLVRLARAAKAVGDNERAEAAFSRVYFESPLSELAPTAGSELEHLPNYGPLVAGSNRYRLEIGRSEKLFGAKRYPDARQAFEALRSLSQGDDRELINIRIAECEYYLKHARVARDGVRPYIEKASRQGEALFFYALASASLGDEGEYLRSIRRVVSEFPDQAWAEDALNQLASRYVTQGEDDQADAVFRDLYERYPTGRYAERAAWKIGWRAYKDGRYADTARVFERASADFPRSDYRPAWLYWAGRSHATLNHTALAEARYTLLTTDYLNTYYGRMAATRLDGRVPQRSLVVDTSLADIDAPALRLPPNQHVIRALLALDLYDQALDELHYAQRVWGDSSSVQATLGWIAGRRGDLRGGINAVKRAYPQYLAAGGEKLPSELLKMIYPVNYWPLIRQYASENHLDPYLMAALILQESNFTADIRSPANAYGLMQLLPATGRRYVKVLSAKRFTLGLLTTAESNIRMGMAYFADLINQFGGAHFALASYNAGPGRVVRWKNDKPAAELDEFIDDIPFPETQNYVKRILGTADDYRRIYGADAGANDGMAAAPQAVAPQAVAPQPAAVNTRAKVATPAPARASVKPAPAKKIPVAPAKKKKRASARRAPREAA